MASSLNDERLMGRVWKLDHDISTDLLSPGTYAVDPVEVRMLHTLESINPAFASDVRAGDVVIAGRNFMRQCNRSQRMAAVGCFI